MSDNKDGGAAFITAPVLVNLNQTVRVKLTNHGRTIHRENWQRNHEMHPKAFLEYRPPAEVDGWSTWQLWGLMHEFGEHIHMGARNPFDLTIEIQP